MNKDLLDNHKIDLEALTIFLTTARDLASPDNVVNGEERKYFKRGCWQYVKWDYGSDWFHGDEKVYIHNDNTNHVIAAWVRSYHGKRPIEEALRKKVDLLLEESIKQNGKKVWVGKKHLVKENLKYHNPYTGDIKKFAGKEIIFLQKDKVYEVEYLGGIVCYNQEGPHLR